MERKFNKQPKLKIRKGDLVEVISGNYRSTTSKVSRGKVLEIFADENRAIVEGIAIVTKHTKPSAGKPEGGIKKIEGTIHISNLMVVDPASGKATRVGRKKDATGKLQRFAKKTGEIIK